MEKKSSFRLFRGIINSKMHFGKNLEKNYEKIIKQKKIPIIIIQINNHYNINNNKKNYQKKKNKFK